MTHASAFRYCEEVGSARPQTLIAAAEKGGRALIAHSRGGAVLVASRRTRDFATRTAARN